MDYAGGAMEFRQRDIFGNEEQSVDSDGIPIDDVRNTDPLTSHEAAIGNRKRRPTQQFRVLKALSVKPHTDYELHLRLNMLRGTVAKRRGELEKKGWVEAVGERRSTDTGSAAMIWRITMDGYLAFSEMERQFEANT